MARAVTALKKYSKAKKEETNQLLADQDESIHLTFTMQQLPKMISPKPIKIDIPFPFHSADRKSRVCVFAKDPINGLKD